MGSTICPTSSFVIFMCAVVVCLVTELFSHFASPWTRACKGPLSMEFSRQEYWSELPFPSRGDIPDPGIESMISALQVGSLLLHHLQQTT